MSVLFGKSLPHDEYDVRFCLSENSNKTTITDFIPQDYPIIRIPKSNALSMIWRMFRIIRRERPHIVFSSVLYLNDKILPLRSLFPSTRFVIRCENYLYTFKGKQRFLVRWLYKLADEIIAQTQEMADELSGDAGIDKGKVHVVQNPIDTELIDKMVANGANPYPNDGKKHIVAVGRFSPQKGFDLLVKAFGLLRQERKDVDLYIVGNTEWGNGEHYSSLMKDVQEKELVDVIHCVGYQQNPYVYINYANCFVLSSRWEGLPNVLIEAQYLGTPVAAFKCIPVVERLVAEGVSGFLAEKENVASLANAIRQALSIGKVEPALRPSSNLHIKEIEKIILGGGNILKYRQLKYWLRCDYESYGMQHPWVARFTYGENWDLFAYLKNLRYLEYCTNKKQYVWDRLFKMIFWLRHRRNCKRYEIFIGPNSVKAGFHLQHRGFRHITSSTKIGVNCEILPMVLIGKKRQDIECANVVVGDNCYISTGVTILGPVTIGDNVTIGASAVVTRDVPDNCVVAGVPARVIKVKNQ